MKSGNRHSWTEKDDIVVFYLYRFKEIGSPFTKEMIAKKLGMTEASLNMRIGNFKAIDGEGGLSHPAELSRQVYERFNSMPKTELKSLVLEILNE